MGYQLWTSPLTGYRRKGTRLSEIRNLFEEGITAKAILEPLKSCPMDADSQEMYKRLEKLDFDVAGVKENKESRVAGFIYKNDLKDSDLVGDAIIDLTPNFLIGSATPLAEIFEILKTKDFIFVLVGQQVQGIITRADLNKPPVRIYLFGLISLFEMHLTFWIHEEYKTEDWKKSLNKNRLKKAKHIQKLRKERNEEVGLLHCLQLCDKRDLVLQNDAVRKILNLDDLDTSKNNLEEIEQLRNSLAHSQVDIANGLEWDQVFKLVPFMENTISQSDLVVEEEASKSSKQEIIDFWATG
ncbi:hypothetical protein CK503_04150 [Aliifodinibius salipaludis]|uniref:CBS domain-containing protein n=1 Tax=Fodinibius salipaludis TaxID=2032627 RepID=A0A2A2GEV5_9BACT|nr:CBS domain-containing protein [Aliifodinibius salipaludis]PAU95395.1 hypothetical protein CK503_04150 [Aliifodinibius salipaludis]